MTRIAHLEWQDEIPLKEGTIRLYECDTIDEANAMFDALKEFVGVVQVAVYANGATRLHSGLWKKRMGMEDLQEMARVLFGSGIVEAYLQRRDGHNMPFGELMTEGSWRGWWKIDVVAVVSGKDGSY